MKLRLTPTTAFMLASIAFAGHALFHYAGLPATLAVHFDRSGRPNGFASREAFLLVTAGFLLLFSLLFWAAGAIEKIPSRYFNIPNRDYWLADARRAESLAFIAVWMRWLLAAGMALQAALMANVLHANLRSPVELNSAPECETFVFLAVLAGLIFWMHRRFPRRAAQ